MDTDELDHWLDAEEEPDRTRWPGSSPPPPPEGSGRRPRWVVVVILGGVLWLGVLAVALLGRASEGETSPEGMAEVLVGTTPTPTGAGGPGADLLVAPTAEAPAAVAEIPPAPTVPAEGTEGTEQGVTTGPNRLQMLHGAAVTALRASLTASSDGHDSYLEHATPIGVQPIGDAAIVTVDATWLEGSAGTLDRVHQGRWAVPVALDGTALGGAWQVQPGPRPLADPHEPPVGALHLAEIEHAMHDAGWREVVVTASDPHPLLADVLIALVAGSPPVGAARTGDVVWLQSTDDGLRLLGVDAPATDDAGDRS